MINLSSTCHAFTGVSIDLYFLKIKLNNELFVLIRSRLPKTSIQGQDNPAIQVLDEANASHIGGQTMISPSVNDLIDSSYL